MIIYCVISILYRYGYIERFDSDTHKSEMMYINYHNAVHRRHYLKERQVEHPEHGEYDRVTLISRHHGNEGQQRSSETQEVHAGLNVEANARQ